MDIPPVQYARTPDGVRLAYQVFGSGPPLLAAPSAPNSHRLYDWRVPNLVDAWTALGRRRTLALYDPRGVGLSDRGYADFSLATQVADLNTVTQALGWERFDVTSGNTGAPLALTYAGMHPERVARLFVWGGLSHIAAIPAVLSLLQVAGQDWELFLRLAIRGLMEGEGAGGEAYIDMLRASVDRDEFVCGAASYLGQDARPWLGRITAQTLVLAASDHLFLGEAVARSLAEAIPGARVRLLPGRSQMLRQPDGSLVLDHFLDFCDELDAAAGAPLLSLAPPPRPVEPPTSREVEVLRLLAQGLSNRAVAERLTLSVRTVERHIANLYAKAGVHDRQAMLAYARAHGYLPLD